MVAIGDPGTRRDSWVGGQHWPRDTILKLDRSASYELGHEHTSDQEIYREHDADRCEH
jgi:hypothetical protein